MKYPFKIILSVVVPAIVIVGFVYFIGFKERQSSTVTPTVPTSQEKCLSADEYAGYPLDGSVNPVLKSPKETTVAISVRSKQTNQEKFTFNISDVYKRNYHPIELQKCAVYVQKELNYNPKVEFNQQKDYRREIWKYSYDGKGEKLFTTAYVNQSSRTFYYESDFRVDPTEKYIALVGVTNDFDSDLVIKDLTTSRDVFNLPLSKVGESGQDLIGNIGLETWTDDGNYFWADTFEAAIELSFVRIEVGTWKYDILPAPPGMKGGDLLNPENGMVTYIEGANPWTADADADQKYKEEFQKRGEIASFYLYNLFTETRYLIATSTDPTVRYHPEWLSDTELQYELPSGEIKIYKVE